MAMLEKLRGRPSNEAQSEIKQLTKDLKKTILQHLYTAGTMDEIAESLLDLAKSGDLKAITLLLDIEGLQTTQEDRHVQLEFNFDNDTEGIRDEE